MPRLHSNRHRAVHLGPLPTERLPRADAPIVTGAQQPGDAVAADATSLLAVLPEYRVLFDSLLDGAVAPGRAALPDDPQALANNLKASAYFLDATLAGVCRLQPGDWLGDGQPPHSHALVLLVECSRDPAPGEPGAAWTRGTAAARTDLRGAEIAVVLAGYVRALGWSARGHVHGSTLVNLAALAQRAGVARAVNGVLAMPFLRRSFRIAVLTTDLVLATDQPIAPQASLDWPDADAYLGVGGTRPASRTPSWCAARCTWGAGRWSASAESTPPPPWCWAIRSAACPSAPTCSPGRWPVTWANGRSMSAPALPSSIRWPSR